MWLLLCQSDDAAALWAAGRLRARGLAPLVVLTPELLQYSFRWQHRLGNDEPASIEFTLADGRTVRGQEIKGVLNRLAALPPQLFGRVAPEDRDYMLQEWTALHISWMSALHAPVLNRPVMQGLCGAWRHRSEWTWLASQAGLPTAPFRQSGSAAALATPDGFGRSGLRTIFVVDERVIGSGVSSELAAVCVRLARAADTRLLGIDLEIGTERFVNASPRPELRLGGERLVAALHGALTHHA